MIRRVLGIDPGLQCTGWGVVEQDGNKLRFVESGVVKTDSKAPLDERLRTLYEGIKKICDFYQPNEAAIEETFVNKNPGSSLKLGQARGAVLLTLALANLPVQEYAATLVKKSVVGVGRAEKNQIAAMVQILLPGARGVTHDALDALAVALCHLQHKKWE